MIDIGVPIAKTSYWEHDTLTIVVEALLFSELRLDALELGLPVDVPLVLLVGLPLDIDFCQGPGIRT